MVVSTLVWPIRCWTVRMSVPLWSRWVAKEWLWIRFVVRTSPEAVTPPNFPALRRLSTAVDPDDKIEICEKLRSTNREGVVFMEVDAPFTPGRPNSGGTMLKYKFFESASLVVIIARI